MERRRFLKVGSRTLGAGLLAGWGLSSRPLIAQEPRPDVVMAKANTGAEAVQRALQALGGMARFVQPGNVVVVKPNASFESPAAWGATTHPEVLSAVVSECLEAGARRVLVVDHTLKEAERCFRRTGTADALEPFTKAKLVSLDRESGYRDVEVPEGKSLKQTKVAGALLKADVFINLPTAKAHSATGVSFGLKNLMGVIWDRQTFHSDMDIHVGIADLATVVRPQLTMVDAQQLLLTRGPAGPGDVETFGGVVAGVDPVAVDAYAVGMASWNHRTWTPSDVAFLQHAAARGVGSLDLASMKILELS